ncbi:MAG: bifunctional riboflavin kinase/FMN adenylyltransferase [Acidobacteriota bacterium]|nr:bifunctional riboflavin kinase/FMN adenylyltransferase [Acidobacteriota bacterium]
MKTYTQLAHLPNPGTPVVATIGNFDGVHLGHQWVIAEVIERARFLGGESIAITFDPHPARVLRPEFPHTLITPLSRKLELLAATGIDATLVLPFTDVLRRMHSRDFAKEILVNGVHVTEVHEGENFRFGYHAEAGAGRAQSGNDSLEALGQELGFGVAIYAPRSLRGAPVSSSRIRSLLTAGALSDNNALSHARALLGRPFSIDSTPASGRGYGAKYAVPTINLAPYPELLPANGVYITTLAIGGHAFEAVTNIGNRPTFGPDSFAVESHLLNFEPIELSERTPLRLTFLRRLREERAFRTTQSLRDQIARDVSHARRYFTLCQALFPTP